MSQLMLLGGASGGQGSGGVGEMSTKQRDELLAQIQKIVEKPIEIKQETVNVNYTMNRDNLGTSGDKFGASVSGKRKSYLEEYEESVRLEKKGNVVSESQGKYTSMVEEDIALRLGVSVSKLENSGSWKDGKRNNQHQESIEDMIGDVSQNIEDSIKDEIGDSHSKISASKQSNRDKVLAKKPEQDEKMSAFLLDIEKAIDSERSDREERLARDLKMRRISPRSYDKGIKEIEKWVVKEKRELY